MKNLLKVCIIALFILVTATSKSAHATTYQVGLQRESKVLQPLLAKLQPGDVVEIDPGEYQEVMKITSNGTAEAPIIIRGIKGGERPIFNAEGINTSGAGPVPRGIFQIEGAYIIIEHLEFKNARNGENSAGIRLLNSTNAIIRDCKISLCDMGIFGGDRETALIENCDVGFNSTEKRNGYAHNFYMSGNRVVVRNSFIHDCPFGQNFKSRAHYNELWYNRIANSNEGEVGIVDGENDTDRPNSNSLLVGNIIVSPRERTGNNWKFILFGSESGHTHDGTLFLLNNTFIAGNEKIKFISLADAKANAIIRNNVFVGSEQILNTMQTPMDVTASGNWKPSGTPLPEGWADAIHTPLLYIDGDGVTQALVESGSTPTN